MAVKTVSRSGLSSKLFENLQSEIDILKSLQHRHITRLIDVFVSPFVTFPSFLPPYLPTFLPSYLPTFLPFISSHPSPPSPILPNQLTQTQNLPHSPSPTSTQRAERNIYLIMEYCAGGDLTNYIKKRGRVEGLEYVPHPGAPPQYFGHPRTGGLMEIVVRSFLRQLGMLVFCGF